VPSKVSTVNKVQLGYALKELLEDLALPPSRERGAPNYAPNCPSTYSLRSFNEWHATGTYLGSEAKRSTFSQKDLNLLRLRSDAYFEA
jgi:hypothetical protein